MIGLLITLLLSSVISISCIPIWGTNSCFMIFIIATICQFAFTITYRQLKMYYLNFLRKKLELEEIKTLNKFEYTIKCASCNKEFNILLGLNETNTFECPHCKQLNNVYFDIKNYIQLQNIQDINEAQTNIYNKIQQTLKNGSK